MLTPATIGIAIKVKETSAVFDPVLEGIPAWFII